ncbi:FHA domain-containing protein [Anaerolineae bacterium CFX9]|jgi:pSer/pThr/pTyr-binding forkhead associated (FHA) protein|nr:FHA domain-containing protein [Anaerolineae bacterium CFX9]
MLFNRKAANSEPNTVAPNFRIIMQVGDDERVYSLPLAPRMIVGRGGDTSVPQINLTRFDAAQFGVSRQHAAVVWDGETLHVEDLQSTNGTRINGKPIDPGALYRLRNGDELEFGSLRVRVRVVRAPDS